MRKKIVTLSLLLLTLFSTSALFANPKQQPTSWLFVIHARHARVMHATNKTILTLRPVREISYFSDRPVRRSGKLTAQRFVKSWQTGRITFRKDHPNAAMVAAADAKTPYHTRKDLFVVLKKPHYQPKKQILQFDISPVIAKKLYSQQYEFVSIFIDTTSGKHL